LFSEVAFEHDDLAGIERIERSLAYLTSVYARVKGIGRAFNAQIGLKPPSLLVVEAKSEAIIGRFASLYRLIAQLITVEYNNT